jgi:hypothetical protein
MVVGFCAVTVALAQPSLRPAAAGASQARPGAAPGAPPVQTLTAEQLAKVKTVLAAYKPGALTADDAKTIKRTLRDAGMRPGPALDKALSEQGFSAARLDVLAPPPPRPAGEDHAQSPPPSSPPPPKR